MKTTKTETRKASKLNDLLCFDCEIEKCPQCGEDGDRRYYQQEYDTLTQLYCTKCKKGYDALEIA